MRAVPATGPPFFFARRTLAVQQERWNIAPMVTLAFIPALLTSGALLLQSVPAPAQQSEPAERAVAQSSPPIDLTLRPRESGLVIMRCRIDESRRYSDCEVAGENPTGYGFADAARRIIGEMTLPAAPETVVIGSTVTFRMPFILEE